MLHSNHTYYQILYCNIFHKFGLFMSSEELLELLVYLVYLLLKNVTIGEGLEKPILSKLIGSGNCAKQWKLSCWNFAKKRTSKPRKKEEFFVQKTSFFGPNFPFFLLKKLDEIAIKLLFLVIWGWLWHYIQVIVIVIATLAPTTKWKKMHWCKGVWHPIIATLRGGTGFKCKKGP